MCVYVAVPCQSLTRSKLRAATSARTVSAHTYAKRRLAAKSTPSYKTEDTGVRQSVMTYTTCKGSKFIQIVAHAALSESPPR